MKKDYHSILIETINSKYIDNVISKMNPWWLRKDLKQEVLLIICEIKPEYLISLYNKRELKFYLIKVILNLINPANSIFHRKYKHLKEFTIDHFLFMKVCNSDRVGGKIGRKIREFASEKEIAFTRNDRLQKENLEDKALTMINDLDWYNRLILELYLETGTYRGMEEKVGIPHITCYKHVLKAAKALKDKVCA